MVAGTVGVAFDPPEAPFDPYLPKPLLFWALSGVMGLFLGVGMALTIEYMDRSILKTTEDVERVVQLPSLGVIPFCVKDRTNTTGQTSGRKTPGKLDEKRQGSDHSPGRSGYDDGEVFPVSHGRVHPASAHLFDAPRFPGGLPRPWIGAQPSSRRREIHGILKSGHSLGPGRPPGGNPGL